MNLSLSVVLPNYNGRALLEAFLPCTFQALDDSGLSYEFIIVDDGSDDGSMEFIASNYPQIKVLENGANGGFSYSCNRGIYEAKNQLIFLVNSDIRLSPDYFKGQLEYFNDPKTFGVMGKILNGDGTKLEIGAKIPRRRGRVLKTDRFYLPETNSNFAPTLFLSGANALIDRQKLLGLGGFDELYSPFYAEDLDLGVRAWRMGWKCYFHEQSTCFHMGSATMKSQIQKSWVKTVYFRNRMLFHAVHLEKDELFQWKAQTILFDVLPKLLIGKTWIWKSLQAFRQLESKISESRRKLNNQLQKNPDAKSLRDIEREFQLLLDSQKAVLKF